MKFLFHLVAVIDFNLKKDDLYICLLAARHLTHVI